jgi:DNA-binding MarR family transcriptional regulator
MRKLDEAPVAGGRDEFVPGLGYLLREAYRGFRRDLEANLAKHSITHSQWVMMWFLTRFGVSTPAELARAAGIKKASATSVIEALRSNGFIRVEKSPDDGRRLNLRLTAEGMRVMSRVSEVVRQANGRTQVALTEAERRQLAHLLGKVVSSLTTS